MKPENNEKLKLNGICYCTLHIEGRYVLAGGKGMLLHDDIHLDWKHIKQLMDIYYKSEND